jgi:hypothetical protein
MKSQVGSGWARLSCAEDEFGRCSESYVEWN